jgi:sugar phosphate isomerase/epimerase
MQLAFSNIAWERADEPALLQRFQEKGLQGIDVAPTKLFADPLVVSPQAIAHQRAPWEAAHIRWVGMQSLLYQQPDLHIFGPPEVQQRTQAYLEKILHLAAQMGIHVLVFGSPKNRLKGPRTPEEALKEAADFFAPLADTATRLGICLCIEPNASDYGCDFITTVAEGVSLVQAVQSPGFGLHVDTGVMTLNGEPIEPTLSTALPWIRHLHISEPFLKPLTDGTTPHRLFGKTLRALGYSRWVSIEMLPTPLPQRIQTLCDCLDLALEAYELT